MNTKKLTKLVCPVLDQTAGACNDGLLDGAFAGLRRLFKQGPQERDALKRLAETHLVRHDTAVLVLDHHA